MMVSFAFGAIIHKMDAKGKTVWPSCSLFILWASIMSVVIENECQRKFEDK